MAMKKFRNMKVYEQSGYQYKSTPAIMLKGQWLREAGFDCGTSITVTCEEGRLVIVPREEEAHPGEKFDMNWNLSLDYIAGDTDDGELDKSSVLAGVSYDPFDEDVPDEVLKLREIAAEKMTDRQRQAYRLIGLEGYSRTEAAKIMGVSVKVAKVHYDKAIECIKKYF